MAFTSVTIPSLQLLFWKAEKYFSIFPLDFFALTFLSAKRKSEIKNPNTRVFWNLNASKIYTKPPITKEERMFSAEYLLVRLIKTDS